MVTLDAQFSLIGALCIAPEIAGEFFGTVREDDFTDATCQTIYQTARSIFLERRRLDMTVIAEEAGQQYKRWLAEIIETTPTAAAWKTYAGMAREQAILQRVDTLAEQLEEARTVEEKQRLVRKMMEQFDQTPEKDESLKGAMFRWMDRQNTPREFVRLGLEPLDDGKLFLTLGKFVVLGARPSVGKTALALQWARELAKDHRVGFFSLETDSESLIDRVLSREAHVPFDRIQTGTLREAEWQVIAERTHWMSKHLNLDLIEAAGFTAEQIMTRSLSRQYDVILIDYLQLIAGDDPKSYDRVTKISMALHTFAQRTKTLVIALAQLRRTNDEPRMSDLRESGQIEQDADCVMLMHLENEEEAESNRVLTIAKNKSGQRGRCRYRFRGLYQEFEYLPPAPQRDRAQERPKKMTADQVMLPTNAGRNV